MIIYSEIDFEAIPKDLNASPSGSLLDSYYFTQFINEYLTKIVGAILTKSEILENADNLSFYNFQSRTG